MTVIHCRSTNQMATGLMHGRNCLISLVLIALVCALVIPDQTLGAEDIIWVIAEGSAPIVGDNIEQARDLAMEMAEWKAIEKAVVANISMETLLVNLKMSGTMIGAIPHAEIVESEILQEIDSSQSSAGESASASSPMYSVKMNIGVVEKTDGQDPSFQIEAALNQTQFVNGEEMQIRLKSTKDCFYCIFILMEDQKVLKLIPNQYRTHNFLESNIVSTIPDDEDRQRGIVLKVYTPADKAVSKEAVYVLGLEQPFDFDNTDIQEGIFGLYNGQTAFLQDLIRRIVGIPIGERAEQLMQYQISKAAEKKSG